MNTTELCKYIEDYLYGNKTCSAIMLNGDWGTGKSYFVEQKLVPYLKKGKRIIINVL